jgi:hypothetical protein
MKQYLIRKWNCKNCSRSNLTEVALNGMAKCEYCLDLMKIQPSRARGGETPDQLSAFIHASPRSLQGEWANLSESAATRRSDSGTTRSGR